MRRLGRSILVALLALTTFLINIEPAHAAACAPTNSRSGGFKYITFTDTSATCTWTVPAGLTLASTILIVGGGGGGGYFGNAGGGGAGALVVTTNFSLTPGATYNITIGAGGAGSTAGRGIAGSPSSFGSVTASGGGYGAGGDPTHYSATYPLVNDGGVGGSGGGGSSYTSSGTSYVGAGGASNATTGISLPWTAYGNAGAGASGAGGGAGGAASGSTAGAGKTYFGNVYAKGGDRSGTISLITGSGNGGTVSSSGGDGSSGSITIQIPTPVFSYSTATPTTPTGSSFANNTVNSTGSIISSYSISPSLPSDLSINSSTGQIEGTPYSTLSATTYTITGTDGVGETGTTTITLTVTAGFARLTFSALNAPKKGSAINLVITAPGAAKIRFFANGKRIANCLAISTTGVSPFTATCSWKPTNQAKVTLTATLISGSSAFTSGSATPVEYFVSKRSTIR